MDSNQSTPMAPLAGRSGREPKQTEILSLWASYREEHPGPPERLLEALGEHRPAFEAYLRAPDRDEYGRGIALLDVAVERSLRAAISLETPAYRDKIQGLLGSALAERDEKRREDLLRQAHGLAARGAAETAAWEALTRCVERRDRALRETRRVHQSQGQVVTAAAALETVSKALQAVVPFVPLPQRAQAREAVERALDDRSAVLLAGMRWWLDTLSLREGEA